MKRIVIAILIVLIFAGLSIGVTAYLIKSKNAMDIEQKNEISNNITDDNSINETNNNTENNKSNEKTIDLRGTYNQNDLIIEEINYEGIKEENGENPKIPQICGLKNKQIQEKINAQIKSSIENKVKDILKNNDVSFLSFWYSIEANFSNVLSIYFRIYDNDGNENANDTIRLNYNLANGENLKFEELFKQDEDLKSILRIVLYKGLVQEQENETRRHGTGTTVRDIYYNNEEKTWYATYDENGKEIIKEYVPPISEYEIEKLIKKFLKQEDKKFSFSPYKLEMEIGDLICYLELKDIADKVVIYNKFLTSESLYEKNDVGVKNIITCSAENNFGKYKETKYESDNFFYDVCLQPEYGVGDEGENGNGKESIENRYKFLEAKLEKMKNEMDNKVKEYKNIAKNNPDKSYFLFLNFRVGENIDYTENKKELVGEFRSNIIVCNIKEKEKVLEKILSCYRYYRVGYYGSIYNYIKEKSVLFEEYTTTENIEKIYYDLSSGKEYKRES